MFNEMAIVFDDETIDVFSSENIGLGASVLPTDGMIGVGHLEDSEGNIVKDPKTINKEMTGISIGGAASVLRGVSEAVTPSGYKFVIKFMQSNASVGISWGITRRVGKLKEL